MNFNDQDMKNDSTSSERPNRLPLVLGLAGAALGAIAFGFVAANAIGGGAPARGTAVRTPTDDVSTPAPARSQEPSPVSTKPTEPAMVAPTATLAPPTPAATVPPITTSKFQDFFRAEGGSIYENTKTLLPIRRADASWDNSYNGCPGAGCIRGKVTAWAALGPFTVGESPSASAQIYNTFTAQRPTANLLMNVKWSGTLIALASANANAEVEIQVVVSETDEKNRVVKSIPGMPFTVISKELGLEAIAGLDTIKLDDSRMINVPLKLEPGAKYRIDLKLSCSSRAALSASVTSCVANAEWTSMVVEYDLGLCSPSQKGEGCIYAKD